MIFHVVDIFGTTDRHQKARKSWDAIYSAGVVPCHKSSYQRTAKGVGDTRELPYLRDLLAVGLSRSTNPDDIILWCNDDVVLIPEIVQFCQDEVAPNGAVSMRRFEPTNPGAVHIGRELLAFRKDWLSAQISKFPDFILGCPFFDIVIAAIIRKHYGIKSTIENMTCDMPPADSIRRYAHHDTHPSGWAGVNEHRFAGNLHNRKLALNWAAFHMPSLSL